jgi:hypothetical protein
VAQHVRPRAGYSYAPRTNSNVRWFNKIDGGGGEFLLTIDPDAFTIQTKAPGVFALGDAAVRAAFDATVGRTVIEQATMITPHPDPGAHDLAR